MIKIVFNIFLLVPYSILADINCDSSSSKPSIQHFVPNTGACDTNELVLCKHQQAIRAGFIGKFANGYTLQTTAIFDQIIDFEVPDFTDEKIEEISVKTTSLFSAIDLEISPDAHYRNIQSEIRQQGLQYSVTPLLFSIYEAGSIFEEPFISPAVSDIFSDINPTIGTTLRELTADKFRLGFTMPSNPIDFSLEMRLNDDFATSALRFGRKLSANSSYKGNGRGNLNSHGQGGIRLIANFQGWRYL